MDQVQPWYWERLTFPDAFHAVERHLDSRVHAYDPEHEIAELHCHDQHPIMVSQVDHVIG
jgi:hypothetical protein